MTSTKGATSTSSPPQTTTSSLSNLYSQLNEQLNNEIEASNLAAVKQDSIPTRNLKPASASNYQSMSSYYFGSSSTATAKNDTAEDGSKTKISVSIIGDAFVDLFCFLNDGSSGAEGGKLPGLGADVRINQPITPVAGGSGINTATHLASLTKHFPFTKQNVSAAKEEKEQGEAVENIEEQIDITLQTVVNESDGYGRLLINHAKTNNFEIINCRRDALRKKSLNDNTQSAEEQPQMSMIPSTGHCIVLVTQNERSFITHLGVMEDFQPSHTIMHELVQCRSADPTFINQHHHIHIAGYYNTPKFHSKNALKKRIKLIREKRRTQSHGKHVYTTTISLTPQYDATEKWETEELFNLLPLVDFLILNLLEACNICKIKVPNEEIFESSNAPNSRLLFLKLADYLNEQSSQTYVVVTLGKAGAVLLYGGDIVYTHQTPKQYDAPLDTTGAGDSFVAGFIFGAMNWRRERQHNQVHEIGSVLEEAGGWTEAIETGIEWGCVTGTACVMKAGASVPSSKKEIEHLLYYDGDDDDSSDDCSTEDGVVVEVDGSYDSENDSDYDPNEDDESSYNEDSEEYSDDEDTDDEGA